MYQGKTQIEIGGKEHIFDTHKARLSVTSAARGFPRTQSPHDTRTSLYPQVSHRKYSTLPSRTGISHSLQDRENVHLFFKTRKTSTPYRSRCSGGEGVGNPLSAARFGGGVLPVQSQVRWWGIPLGPWYRPLPLVVDRQTENITFPHTPCVGGNKYLASYLNLVLLTELLQVIK